MLLKKKAVGNTSIAVEDRFTVAVSFRATGQVQYVYFSRSTSLGEAMSSLGEAFTRAAYGTAARPEGMSLSVVSDADADADVDSGSGGGYQGWDLRAPLSMLVPEFAELQVEPVRTTVVVARQSALEQDLLLRQALQGSPAKPSPEGSSSSASASASDSEPSVSAPLDRDYKKGDGVVYTGQDGTSFTAIVTGVHFDDPPDTYYTITYNGGQERQTVHRRLRLDPEYIPPAPKPTPEPLYKAANLRAPPGEAEASAPGTVSFRVALGAKVADLKNYPVTKTVLDLKKYIQAKSKIPVSTQKLACKGSILKDHQTIADTKIVDGSRVTLMSREASKSSCSTC
jgi:hypothetical protein